MPDDSDLTTRDARPSTSSLKQPREWLVLLGLLATCLAVAGIGGAVTSLTVESWYQDLRKPSFNPPDWVFAPVWTTLYVLMAVAAWRIWRRRTSPGRGAALVMFAVQLCLNLLWSCLFFGLTAVGAALADIVALWLAVAVTTWRFGRIDALAGCLLVPYAVWVAYAAALNAAIWWLN